MAQTLKLHSLDEVKAVVQQYEEDTISKFVKYYHEKKFYEDAGIVMQKWSAI